MEYVRPFASMIDGYLHLDPGGFSVPDDTSLAEFADLVHVLGKCFRSSDFDEIKSFSSSRIWLTYRRNFTPIGGFGGPTSDSGWGCMIRCGQMLLAQALTVVHLGREWRWKKREEFESDPEFKIYQKVLQRFEDKKQALFSIHQIAQMGVSEGKELGEWLGPNTIAQVLKKLVVYDDWSRIAIHVALDNVLISEDVNIMAAHEILPEAETQRTPTEKAEESGWKRPVLIIVPLRLGLTVINECYSKAIQEFFKLSQCVGILGGRPNHAVYFYGAAGSRLLYLDPHVCQPFHDLEPRPGTPPSRDRRLPEAGGSSSLSSTTSPPSYLDSTLPTTEGSDGNISSSFADYNGSAHSTSPAKTRLRRNSFSKVSSMNFDRRGDFLSPQTQPTLSQSLSSTDCSNFERVETSTGSSITSSAQAMVKKPVSSTSSFDSDARYISTEILSLDDSVATETEINGATAQEPKENGEVQTLNDDSLPVEEVFPKSEPPAFDDSSFHCPHLLSMDFKALDPSLALAFLCLNAGEYENLVAKLKESVLPTSSPPLFEILDQRPKGWPKFVPYTWNNEDSFTMKEYDDFGDPDFDDEQFEILEL